MKKITLQAAALVGALMTAVAGLSGLIAFLFGSGRAAFDDPTVIWFAPLYLTPLALAGVGLMAIGSLASKQKRELFGWSCLAFAVALVVTAATFTLTGLSTGEIELVGTYWGTAAVVLSLLYAASMVVLSVVGVIIAKHIHGMESEGQPSGLTGVST